MATLISDTARAPQQKDTAVTLLQIGAKEAGSASRPLLRHLERRKQREVTA